MTTLNIVGWNVNGLRSCLTKNKLGKKKSDDEKHVIQTLVDEHKVDILCLQETKCPEECDARLNFKFSKILASKTKKGYSGVAVYSNIEPLNVLDDFPYNEEGRVIVLEFAKFYLMNTYTPNSKPDLSRLDYRVDVWEKEIREYLKTLQKKKPVIYLSDFNVAPSNLDIYNPKGKEKMHGFTPQERGAFAQLLDECGLIDTFRHLHPTEKKYTWFSNFAQSRQKNNGWRIDHVLVSKKLKDKVERSEILSDFYGSDHVPIKMVISF